jgi:hypothetical protein
VLISEGDAFLIMHLWELYPGLGRELSHVVRTLRTCAVTPDMLNDGTWRIMCGARLSPRLVNLVTTEVNFMRAIGEDIELAKRQHTGITGSVSK